MSTRPLSERHHDLAPGGPRRVVDRFPAPTPEEKQAMWRRAVDENYATAYLDLKN